MFTLTVTALAVLAVLGFLVRITDLVLAGSTITSPRRSVVSDGRRANDPPRAPADLRGLR